MFSVLQKNYLNSRLLAVALLGFSSGLPLFLIGSTLQAWFTASHVSLATIGLLSLIGLPYALKFLWAPVLDYVNFFNFGLRRGWILFTQIGLILSLCLLSTGKPASAPGMMAAVALIIAFFSASQDVAIDAYRTEILNANERGLGAAYAILTYRIAMLIAGGLALILADHIGFSKTYLVMAGLLGVTLCITWCLREPQISTTRSRDFFNNTKAAIFDLWQRETIIVALLFVLFYKFGDALLSQLLTTFFMNGLHFSLTTIGFAYKVVGFTATILGALIGGILLVRLTIERALLIFGLLQAFSNLTFVLLAMLPKNLGLMMSAVFIENGCGGLSTAALLTWMMAYCRPPFTATQFALLSAVLSLGRVGLGPVAASLVQHFGWETLFATAFVLSFPGLIILLFLKKDETPHYVTA